MTDHLLTPEDVAERLCYTGDHPVRYVRALLRRHGSPFRRLGTARGVRLTEADHDELLERMKCTLCENEEMSIGPKMRSVWRPPRKTSKETLRDAIAKHREARSKTLRSRKRRPGDLREEMEWPEQYR